MLAKNLTNRKGQSSIEFLTVFGIAMLMAAPFIVSAETSITELRTGTEVAELENSLNNLEDAIQTVASQGEPARRTITMDIPGVVEDAYMVENQAIVYTLNVQGQQTNVTRIFENRIETEPPGIPEERGRHELRVEAWQNQVNITEDQ